MPENSQKKMSEGDNPSDFNADEVIDYLDTASEEEAYRVGDAEFSGEGAKKRSTVGEAANKRLTEVREDSSEEEDSEDEEDGEEDVLDDEEDSNDYGSLKSFDFEDEEDEDDLDPGEPRGADEMTSDEKIETYEDLGDYNPFKDPDVPDSATATTIQMELQGQGESPTLEACRSARR